MSTNTQITYLRSPDRSQHVIEIRCGDQAWFIDRHSGDGMKVGRAPVPNFGEDWEEFDLLEMIDNDSFFQE